VMNSRRLMSNFRLLPRPGAPPVGLRHPQPVL